jgi:hypothetical protein
MFSSAGQVYSSIRLIRKIRFIRIKLPSRWPEDATAKSRQPERLFPRPPN